MIHTHARTINTYFIKKIDFKYSSDYKKLSTESIFLEFQKIIYFDILFKKINIHYYKCGQRMLETEFPLKKILYIYIFS